MKADYPEGYATEVRAIIGRRTHSIDCDVHPTASAKCENTGRAGSCSTTVGYPSSGRRTDSGDWSATR